MEDTIHMRQPRDLSRVRIDDDLEERWWAHRFGVTRMELRVALEEVGCDPEEVAKFTRTL